MKNLKPYCVINRHLLSSLPGQSRRMFQRARVEPLRLISFITLLLVIGTWAFGSGGASAAGTVELVSVNLAGNGSGNSQSIIRSISADGRYVLFDSFASDLAANDGNNSYDVFVRDMQAHTTYAVSVNSAGTGTGNSGSTSLGISADGRYVLFLSFASNLVSNDSNGFQDVFVRDLQAGTTTLVSVSSAGTGTANDNSYEATISADGRYVAFRSNASNLVSNDTNGKSPDAFVRDLQTGTTKLISVNSAGTASSGANSVSLSAGGRFVAFVSNATDLVANMTLTPNNNIFLRDLQTDTTTLVSVNSSGSGGGNGDSSEQVISSDGRFVAFESFADNLAPNDNNGGRPDVFLRDMQSGTVTLVSVNSSMTGSGSGNSTAPVISANGRYVAFLSEAGNLVSNDTNGGLQDVFVRDTQAGTTALVSVSSDASASGNGFSSGPISISSDGQRVAFTTQASNLVGNDSNGSVTDVFVRDLQAGTTILASGNSAGTGSGNGSSIAPVISSNGLYVAYMSGASDLALNDTNGNVNDIFRFTIPSGPSTDRLRFSASAYSVGEGAGSATITVERIGDANDTLTTNYSTSNGTATAGSDYTSASGGLTFAPGETSKTFSVLITNDALNETAETIGLSLSNSSSTAVLTITDDDPLPALSINDVTIVEGNAGQTNVTFTVTLTPVSGRSVSVLYATVPQGAVHPNDYTFTNGTLNFAPGETTKNITVPVTGDTAFEGNETFDMVLSNPVGATIADDRGVCTIVDDDSVPTISINDLTVAEGNSGTKDVTFTISLSAASSQQVTVNYISVSGTAKENTDYFGISGAILFFPGITTRTVTVSIKGDLIDEPDETFSIRLSNPTNGAIIGKADGVCTITDDDPTPGLYIYNMSVAEGDSGTTNAKFTVSLFAVSGKTITVNYATADGTATAGSDYAATSGTLTFAPGDLVGTITVPIHGDTISEGNETFGVNLTNPVNAELSIAGTTGTIVDDESPSVQMTSSVFMVSEGTANTQQGFGSLAVTVVRTGDMSAPATVQYLTSDASAGRECNQVSGSASQRCDYTSQAGTLRFAAGEGSKTIQIPIVNDAYQEGVETFGIKLQNATGVPLGSISQATVIIADDAPDADIASASGANNPYLSNSFFVRMNYLDFLSREPDQSGFADWTNVLNTCGPQKGFINAPPGCDRAHVSHGFFASPEFTDTGFLIYRMYAVGMNRLPRFAEFTPDMASLSGFGLSDTIRQQNLQDYLQQFTAKTEFTNRFSDALQPSQAATLIQKLEQTAGITLPETAVTNPGQPTQYGRQQLIDLRANGTFTLGQTLKAFVEQQACYDRYFTAGEVTMMYFAYLKRDPDLNDPNLVGWNEWVFVFTNGGAERGRPDIQPRDIHHLTFGFIYSEEYRKRFGTP